MSKKDLIIKELQELILEGREILSLFEKSDSLFQFSSKYQRWYTKALKVVESCAPDRYAEFRSYYEINPKRKLLDYGSYVIQDFVKGVVPGYPDDFNAERTALQAFLNQFYIFLSLQDRIESLLGNIEDELYAEIQDNEVIIARQLMKVSPRAAGALMGVLIEGHLQKVAAKHSLRMGKKNPTISDLNDPLKKAGIIDTATWRKISYFADIRNLCTHKKNEEPSRDQVSDLIEGADWVAKNVS